MAAVKLEQKESNRTSLVGPRGSLMCILVTTTASIKCGEAEQGLFQLGSDRAGEGRRGSIKTDANDLPNSETRTILTMAFVIRLQAEFLV